jgi:3-hydroxy-4-methylanthranilate adenylyltransferase
VTAPDPGPRRAPEPHWIPGQVLCGPADVVGLSCDTEVTFGQIEEQVASWTARLAGLGVGADTAVALRLPPCFTYIYLLLAIWRLDAQIVLVDHRSTDAEAQSLLDQCRPRFEIRGARPAGLVLSFTEEREVTVMERDGSSPRGSEHCLIQSTSGSTGRPKVIGRTVADLVEELARFDEIDGGTAPGDRVLLLNSIHHTFGLVGGILHTFRQGASLLFAKRNQGRDIIERLNQAGATVVFGVPFHFELMGSTPTGGPGGPLRIAVSGGEMLGGQIRASFEDRYRVPIGQAYGMTETGILAADYHGRHPGAVGTVSRSLRTRLVDDQLEVHTGRSPYLFGTGEGRLRDGWLKTFDNASFDPVGRVLTVRGRSDSLVIIGGLKVDLTEIEQVVKQHPEVTEAVVVMGESIEAYIEAADGFDTAQLAPWYAAHLAAVKIPKLSVPLRALPRTTTGKLKRDREALRQAAADQLARRAL